MKIVIGTIEDISAIHSILKKNLVDMQTLDDLTKERKDLFETNGFLRKEVPPSFYQSLIEDENTEIYVAKREKSNHEANAGNKDGLGSEILGFASIYKSKSNVYEFRSTLVNLYPKNDKINDLLINPSSKFVYLDQIAVLPEWRRKGVATKLLKAVLESTRLPIVAFIVKKPITNQASIYWHQRNGFELGAVCDGNYKDENLEWDIFIHWN